jgi:hypothetical protein
VRVWDATPVNQELAVFRESRSLVEPLSARALPAAEVVDRIRRDATLTEPVRAKALELAELYESSRVVREVERLISTLFAQWQLQSEVVERLRSDKQVAEPVRRQALGVAEHAAEDPNRLYGASWGVASRPDLDPAAYALALRQSEQACRLVPRSWIFLTGLGVARYRIGQYQGAVDALTQAVEVRASLKAGPRAADLAFLALSRHRLGHSSQARADLSRLRDYMNAPARLFEAQDHDFLREAETIEREPAFPANPFAP